MSHNYEGICVAIRPRPLKKGEGQEKVFICDSEANSIVQTKDNQPVEGWSFDKVFDDTSSTEGVYTHVAKNIVEGVVRGINGTIFACKLMCIIIIFASIEY